MLEAGLRIGHYQIAAVLGAGGMGEVYRASDMTLGREVALKVLPEDFATDPERHARFEREAMVLASLNHPNVATLYGVEHVDGQHVLVMELVEGEGLDERVARGAMPPDEAVPVALQIAEALAAAHERGIVHRDLKPANVKVRADGTAKVLDFGLARAWAKEGDQQDVSLSPTITARPVSGGVIVGTAAYMAPEQARGKPVDRRADVWAFGAVLYEMLTGRRLIGGETVTDVLTAVVMKEPDISGLPPNVGAPLRRLLRRCLEKDPRRRMRDMGDVRLELEEALSSEDGEAPQPPAEPRRSALPWSVAAVLALTVAALVVVMTVASRHAAAPPTLRVSPLTQMAGLEVQPTISPDGKLVAYASNANGNWDIYLVRSGGGTEIDLTASSPADDIEPSFSPDGEHIAFRSERDGGGIFVMGATGESARRLTDAGYNPSWSPDGRQIVYSSESVTEHPAARSTEAALSVVDVATGEAAPLFDSLDAVQPAWSPHGQRIAFWGLPFKTGQRDIWTIAADGSDPVRVTDDAHLDWSPAWSPDGRFLYFSSDRGGSLNLWRVAIDERSGVVLSPPQAVVVPSRWCGQATLSADGTSMVYTALDRRANAERVAFDPARLKVVGAPEPVTRGTMLYSYLDPSPDGSRLALVAEGPPENLYVLRLSDHELRRLTDDPAKERGPRWTPDGQHIGFYSDRGGNYEIWWIRPDGSGLEQLTRLERTLIEAVWAPRGLTLATVTGEKALLADLGGPLPARVAEPLPPLAEGEVFWPTSWSPDGSRLAGVGLASSTAELLPGVVVYSLAERSYRRVGDVVAEWGEFEGLPTWLPDSRHVVVGSDSGVDIVDTVTGAGRVLLAAPAGSRLFAPRVTDDGHTLYFLRLEEEANLWMATLGGAS